MYLKRLEPQEGGVQKMRYIGDTAIDSFSDAAILEITLCKGSYI